MVADALSSGAKASPGVGGLVGSVSALGIGLLAAAAAAFATSPVDAATLAGVLGLLVAAAVAERYPVPLYGIDTGGVTLGFVFCVATTVVYGWAAGVIVAFAAPITHLLERRPPVRVMYNASVLGVAAAAGGAAIQPLSGHEDVQMLAQVAVCAAVHYALNLLLISAVVSVTARKRLREVVRTSMAATLVPFALMGSVALVLVVLWQRSPFLSAALVGPLLSIALYQRSSSTALRAMRLAMTDPLTGLGNHRHFHDRLRLELIDSEAQEYPLSLCLVDIDDFKRVNDRFGHPAGDRVLAQLATNLRQGGEAFRLGGDEFALLLPGRDAQGARKAAEAILRRLAAVSLNPADAVTVSAGISTISGGVVDPEELVRRADSALYWAKELGKNQVHVYRPDVLEIAELRQIAAGPDPAARLRAAASLARAVDTRDAFGGSHSERVALLAAKVAARLGVDHNHVELTRLAGSLHDLGKLGVPEEILRKPGPLSATERSVLERHPEIGHRMLESLGVAPVAEWVLRHHERWDGSGYPDGVAGDTIPLGARIIFVADAFDAMTSERVYGRRRSETEALRELERCSGSQFDPLVVAALAEELGYVEPPARAVSA